MKKYRQLGLAQRYQIQVLLEAGLPQKKIADQIGVHKSTVGRELKRNMPRRGRTAGHYIGEHAQGRTDRRHSKKPKRIVLDAELKKRIEGLLKHEKWSPELISKRLAREREKCASHETIYRWIWTAKHSNHRRHRGYKGLYRYLRHTGRRQKRGNIRGNRGAITGRVGIG